MLKENCTTVQSGQYLKCCHLEESTFTWWKQPQLLTRWLVLSSTAFPSSEVSGFSCFIICSLYCCTWVLIPVYQTQSLGKRTAQADFSSSTPGVCMDIHFNGAVKGSCLSKKKHIFSFCLNLQPRAVRGCQPDRDNSCQKGLFLFIVHAFLHFHGLVLTFVFVFLLSISNWFFFKPRHHTSRPNCSTPMTPGHTFRLL